MKLSVYIITLVLLLTGCKPKTITTPITFAGKPVVPDALLRQHDSLLNQLGRFSTGNDSTARAARKLHELLTHHFQEEEDYALPALGLLPALANGEIPQESKAIIGLIETFRSNNQHMSFEHQMVKAYLDELRTIAANEGHPGIEEFSRDLINHAKDEDEIYFPTVILVSEYLKLRTR
jgi:hypothetical protein